MMSPTTLSPGKRTLIPKEIAAIREEITLIDLHRTEHVDGSSNKIRQPDESCKYCQPYLQKVTQPPAAEENQSIMKARPPLATVNNLERTVEIAGKKGQITVPRSWAGKRVRVTLI